MPIKQELLSFPLRKSVTSQGKPRRAAKGENKSNLEDAYTMKATEVDTSNSRAEVSVDSFCDLNPQNILYQKRTPRLTAAFHSRRRSSRRKEHPVSYCDGSVSPDRQVVTTLNSSPKKSPYERELSPESTSLSRDSSRSRMPGKRTHTRVHKQGFSRQNESFGSNKETDSSPRKLAVRANEGSDSDETLSTEKKQLLKRESSPEVFPLNNSSSALTTRSVTPNRNTRNIESEQGHQTPNKRKISSGMECVLYLSRFVIH